MNPLRILSKTVTGLHFNETSGVIEVVKDGPIAIGTLFKIFEIPDLKAKENETTTQRLARMWREFKDFVHVPKPDIHVVNAPPVKKPDEKSITPKLMPLDDDVVTRFQRLHTDENQRRETKSSKINSIKGHPLEVRDDDEGPSRISSESESSQLEDGLNPVNAYQGRLPPHKTVKPSEPIAYDPAAIRAFLLKHFTSEASRLEGRLLQAFVNQVIHAEEALVRHKSSELSNQLVKAIETLACENHCHLSPDKLRFAIQIPSTLDRKTLPIITDITVNEIWIQMSRQLAIITKFTACVNAVANSYAKWKDSSDRDRLAIAAVVKIIESGWLWS